MIAYLSDERQDEVARRGGRAGELLCINDSECACSSSGPNDCEIRPVRLREEEEGREGTPGSGQREGERRDERSPKAIPC